MDLVIGAQIARELGITSQAFTKYKNAGILDKAKAGFNGKRQLYDKQRALELIKSNLDPNYTKSTPQIKNRDTAGGNGGKKPDSFLKARILSEQVKAADRQLDYEIKRKKYLPRDHVERFLFQVLRQVRESLLNQPARTAARVAAKSKKKEKEIYQILMAENEQICRDCAEGFKKITV